MNRNKQIHLWILLILIASSIAVSGAAELPQDIYVLLVIDNGNPTTGHQHETNKQRIETLMQRSVVSMLTEKGLRTTVSIDELLSNDRQVTKSNILGWLQEINPGPDDVVFVYFSGHGGADKTGAKERFFYVERNEKLYRKELVKAMEGLNCRLKILITATGSTGPPPTKPKPSTNTRRFVGVSTDAPLTQTDVLRQLFFEHKGFLNLTATSLGHVAMGSADEGGWFTKALIEGMLPAELSELDRNPQDGFVSWEEVFELTTVHLNHIYQASLANFSERLKERLQQPNQTTQTPEVLSDFPKRVQ